VSVAATLALAIASLALGATGDLELELGVHGEGRTRTVAPRGGDSTTAAEAAASPRVGFALSGPDLALSGAYDARLSTPDLLTDQRLDVLHAAELRARLRASPEWRLTLLAAGALGTTDLLAENRRAAAAATAAAPATPAAPGVTTLATTDVLHYRSARTELLAEGAPDGRTAVTANAGCFLDGGDGPRSRALLPTERGLLASAGMDWRATRLDRLGSRLSATALRFGEGQTAALAIVTGTWRRSLERALELWMGAGAIGAYQRQRGASAQEELLPEAELGMQRGGARAADSEQLLARLDATVDRATGAVARQLEGSAIVRWVPATAWTLSGRGALAFTRQSLGSGRRGTGELRADWASVDGLLIGFGVYGDWQRTPAPAAPSFFEGGTFLSFGYTAPRFAP